MNTEAIVVSVGSFLAMALLFREKGLWAAVLAGILAWKFPDPALAVAGVVLLIFVAFTLLKRLREKPVSEIVDSNIIDAEFTKGKRDG